MKNRTAALLIAGALFLSPFATYATIQGLDLSSANTSRIFDVATQNGCTSWTPSDQSGASLTFTSISAQYCQFGNMIYAYGTFTYPSTSNGNNAAISLPVAVPNQNYAKVTTGFVSSVTNTKLTAIPNTSTAQLVNGTGAPITNAGETLAVINFMIVYPAQ